MNTPRNLDPGSFIRVRTISDIDRLQRETEAVFVFDLDDAKLSAISARLLDARHIMVDGNTHRVTDAGLASLASLSKLETLDLEWSSVTDEGLPKITAIESLRWVDLGFCKGITERGAAEFEKLRPDVQAIFAWI